MAFLWDYDRKELEKTEAGRIKLLEREINYGPEKGTKIRLSDVKKYWNKLELFDLQKKLFELLIWGKYSSKPKSNKSYWIKPKISAHKQLYNSIQIHFNEEAIAQVTTSADKYKANREEVNALDQRVTNIEYILNIPQRS